MSGCQSEGRNMALAKREMRIARTACSVIGVVEEYEFRGSASLVLLRPLGLAVMVCVLRRARSVWIIFAS